MSMNYRQEGKIEINVKTFIVVVVVVFLKADNNNLFLMIYAFGD